MVAEQERLQLLECARRFAKEHGLLQGAGCGVGGGGGGGGAALSSPADTANSSSSTGDPTDYVAGLLAAALQNRRWVRVAEDGTLVDYYSGSGMASAESGNPSGTAAHEV